MALSQDPNRLPMWVFGSSFERGVAASNFSLGGANVRSRNIDVIITGGAPQTHGSAEDSPIASLTASVRELHEAVNSLKHEMTALREQLESVVALAGQRPSEVSDDDAKREIKEYFESLDGETLYPSEISESLNLDYDQVVRTLRDLVEDGEIAAT
jgi:hypothetical protein